MDSLLFSYAFQISIVERDLPCIQKIVFTDPVIIKEIIQNFSDVVKLYSQYICSFPRSYKEDPNI